MTTNGQRSLAERLTGIDEIECITPDLNGVPRGKVMTAEGFLEGRRLQMARGVLLQCIMGGYPPARFYGSDDGDLALVAEASRLWLVDRSFGRLFVLEINGDFPAPLPVVTEVGALGSGVRGVRAATGGVDVVLRERLGVRELLIGHDHGFGRARSGVGQLAVGHRRPRFPAVARLTLVQALRRRPVVAQTRIGECSLQRRHLETLRLQPLES